MSHLSSRLSVGQRIGAAFLVVVVTMLALSAVGVSRVSAISGHLTTINDSNSVKQRYAINFRGSVHDRAIAVRDVVLATTPAEVDTEVARIATLADKYRASEVKLDAIYRDASRVNGPEKAARAEIDRVQAATLPLVGQVVDLTRRGQHDQALSVLEGQAKPLFVEWLKSINVLIDLEEAQNKTESDQARGIASAFSVVMFGLCLVAAVLAAVVGWWTARSVTRPLGQAAEVMAAVAAGDLTGRLDVPGRDEVSRMARSTNEALETVSGIVRTIRGSARAVSDASGSLTGLTGDISASADQAAREADVVAAAASQVSLNVQTVATGADEMGASIREIAQNTSEAARVARDAVQVARRTNVAVATLGGSSREIGDVVKVITSIAEQTNLLALNATIEAARAGESGKGFAVVAGEVKELAQATAKATGDISQRIEAIQSGTAGAVAAIAQIVEVIGQINDYQSTIATAVEEQTATTTEMSRSVADAAASSTRIADSIGGIAAAASTTRAGVTGSQRATGDLAVLSGELVTLVDRFTV